MITFIKKEIGDFKQMSLSARELLKINFINSITSVVSTTFVGAYLWSKTSGIKMFIVYYISMFIILPFAFYINGLLLKKINIIKLHVSGVFVSLIIVVFIMFVEKISIYHMAFAGMGMGIGLALYWANRIYLLQMGVKNDERDMFNSANSALNIVPNVVLPTIIGYFLVIGERYGLYSKDIAYKFLGILTVFFGFILYYYARHIKIVNPKIATFKVRNKSKLYSRFRYFMLIEGLAGSASFFIPSILILKFLGQEDMLGSVVSISSILAAITVYTIGKKIQSSKRTYARIIIILLLMILTANIAINPGKNAILLYTIAGAITGPIIGAVFFTLYQLSIDKLKINDNDIYPYILSAEIHLNLGRLLGFAILIGLYYWFGEQIAVQSILMITTASMLTSLVSVEKLNQECSKNSSNSDVCNNDITNKNLKSVI